MRQPPECLHTKHFGGLSTFKISHFLIKFRSKCYTFFDASFSASFFENLVRLGAQKVDFGSPLAPNWPKKTPQILQKASRWLKKFLPPAPKDHSWNRSASKIAFGTLLVTVLLDFYSMLDRFLTRLSPKKFGLRTPLCSFLVRFLMDLTLNVKVCL